MQFLIFSLALQGVYVIKEHRMPNYVVPGIGISKGDKYMNVQKVKSRLEKHIETIFESSYMTEIIEFPWEPNKAGWTELQINGNF